MKRFYLIPNKFNGCHTGVLSDNGKLSAAQFLAPGTAKRLRAFRRDELKILESVQSEALLPSRLG